MAEIAIGNGREYEVFEPEGWNGIYGQFQGADFLILRQMAIKRLI